MPAPATPFPPTPTDAGTGAETLARDLIQTQLELLGRLAEIGLELAEGLGRQAKGALAEGEGPVTGGDIALAYARVARAVRQTVLLQTKLIEGLGALEDGRARARQQAEREASIARITLLPQRKARLRRIIEGVADTDIEEQEPFDTLCAEADERLEHEDYGDLLARPLSEIVAHICKDLGLSPDWPALAEDAWALEEVAGGKVGAPLAELRAGSVQNMESLPLDGVLAFVHERDGEAGEGVGAGPVLVVSETPPALVTDSPARSPPTLPFPHRGGRSAGVIGEFSG